MLKIVKSISELNIPQFLSVYQESVHKNGRDLYRDYPEIQQINLSENDLLNYMRDDFFRQRDAFCAGWMVECVYKSILRIEPFRDGVLLHALETVPKFRKNGYGYELVQSVIAYLKQSQCKVVYSHIHKRNVSSLRLHKKCGFQIISESAVLVDGTITQNYCTMCLEL